MIQPARGYRYQRRKLDDEGQKTINRQHTKFSVQLSTTLSKRDPPKQAGPQRNNQRNPGRATVPESRTLRCGRSRRRRSSRAGTGASAGAARDARGLAGVQRRGGRRLGAEAAVRRRGRGPGGGGGVRDGVGREGQDRAARVGVAHGQGQRVSRQRLRDDLCLAGDGS